MLKKTPKKSCGFRVSTPNHHKSPHPPTMGGDPPPAADLFWWNCQRKRKSGTRVIGKWYRLTHRTPTLSLMNTPDSGDEACCLFVLLSDLVGCEENLLGIPQDDPCWEFQEDCPHNKLEQRATQQAAYSSPGLLFSTFDSNAFYTQSQLLRKMHFKSKVGIPWKLLFEHPLSNAYKHLHSLWVSDAIVNWNTTLV